MSATEFSAKSPFPALTQTQADARYPLLIDVTAGFAAVPVLAPATSTRNVITPTGDFVPLTLTGFAAQLSDLLKVQKSDGTGYTKIDNLGRVVIKPDTSLGSNGPELLTDGDFATDPTGIWSFASPWVWNTTRMNYAGTTGGIASVAINYGGTGYTTGDVLTVTNGANDATLTVSTVSGGVITGVTISAAGSACSVNASAAVTGGTGTGALFQIIRLVDAGTLSYPATIIASNYYKVVYTVAGMTAGQLNVTVGNTAGLRITASGTYTQLISSTDTSALVFTPTVDFVGNIDNISLKIVIANPPMISIYNADGSANFEIRPSGSSIANPSVLIGANAGGLITGGSQTVAIGASAGQSIVSANGNVFVGYGTGLSTTTGGNNVYVGVNAGQFNVSGTSNVAIGLNAGRANITGGSNVSIGVSAGASNIASQNVYIGGSAGGNATTATENVFIGPNAGSLVSTGSQNTIIGSLTGQQLRIGAGNILIGRAAGNILVTGNNNVFIGNSAGISNKTGSSNVFIGITAGGAETGSNKLYIMNSSVMLPLIWGDFSALQLSVNGVLGISTTNPTAKLDIVGTDATTGNFGLKLKQTGAELIINAVDQNFSGAGNWTGTGWAVTGGVFLHTVGNTADADLGNAFLTASQIVSLNIYKVVFTVASCTQGTLTPKVGTTVGQAVASNTTFTQYIAASGNNVDLIFTPSSDFNGSIDNISIKWLKNTWTIDNTGIATLLDGANFVLGTTTGTKFGTATSQKLAFFNSTPIVQPANTVGFDTALINLGLRATGTTANFDNALSSIFTDAVTAAVTNIGIFDHESSGTPAASFGTGIAIRGKSATVANRDMARLRTIWTTATDASRIANLIISVFNTAEVDLLTLTPTLATISQPTIIGTAGANTAMLNVNGAASGIGAIIRANATTPGDLLQLQNSTPVNLSRFDSTGKYIYKETTTNISTLAFSSWTDNSDVTQFSISKGARWDLGGVALKWTGISALGIGLTIDPSATNVIQFTDGSGSATNQGFISVHGIDIEPGGSGSQPVLQTKISSRFTGNLINLDDTLNGGATRYQLTAAGISTQNALDAVTVAITNVLTIGHNSSGTPGVGFGTGMLFTGQSSTTTNQGMARLRAIWAVATDASRSSNMTLSVFTTSEVDVLTLAANGIQALQDIVMNDARNIIINATTGTKIGTAVGQKIGFWNATPIVQPSGASQAAVAATGSTNVTPFGFTTAAQADAIVTLVNALRTALVNAGLIKGSA